MAGLGELGFSGGEVVTTAQFNGQLGSMIELNDYITIHYVINIDNVGLLRLLFPLGLVIVADLCEEKEEIFFGSFSLEREET